MLNAGIFEEKYTQSRSTTSLWQKQSPGSVRVTASAMISLLLTLDTLSILIVCFLAFNIFFLIELEGINNSCVELFVSCFCRTKPVYDK